MIKQDVFSAYFTHVIPEIVGVEPRCEFCIFYKITVFGGEGIWQSSNHVLWVHGTPGMPCFPATLRSHQLATCGSTDLHRRRRKVACVANVSGAPGDGPGDKLPGHSRDSLVGDKSTLILLLICSSFSTLRIKWDPPMKGSEPV